jgi:hypothetical protein
MCFKCVILKRGTAMDRKCGGRRNLLHGMESACGKNGRIQSAKETLGYTLTGYRALTRTRKIQQF